MDTQKVCQFLVDARSRGDSTVLVTVGAVEGSSMRNPGTIMGVAGDGSFAGSLSGGCIESAVVAEALDVLKSGQPRVMRFGAGSRYLDIRLPCGGGLDLTFNPLAGPDFALACLGSIRNRTPFSIQTGPDKVSHIEQWRAPEFDVVSCSSLFGHWPAPLLQIVGHGASVEALASLAHTFGCTSRILSPDEDIIEELRRRSLAASHLRRTSQTELLESDPWTATVFLFHDHNWEIDLIEAALAQPHFYLGAMGGRKAHAFRSEALAARGVSAEAIATIRAPIGLFHSSRDPQTLALSTLGEVIRAYEATDFEAALG